MEILTLCDMVFKKSVRLNPKRNEAIVVLLRDRLLPQARRNWERSVGTLFFLAVQTSPSLHSRAHGWKLKAFIHARVD